MGHRALRLVEPPVASGPGSGAGTGRGMLGDEEDEARSEEGRT